MKSIASVLHSKLGMNERTSAWLQLGVSCVGIVTIILFPDFFLALSILIAIFLPLLLLYTYLFKCLYSAIFYLNSTP